MRKQLPPSVLCGTVTLLIAVSCTRTVSCTFRDEQKETHREGHFTPAALFRRRPLFDRPTVRGQKTTGTTLSCTVKCRTDRGRTSSAKTKYRGRPTAAGFIVRRYAGLALLFATGPSFRSVKSFARPALAFPAARGDSSAGGIAQSARVLPAAAGVESGRLQGCYPGRAGCAPSILEHGAMSALVCPNIEALFRTCRVETHFSHAEASSSPGHGV